MFPIVPHCSSLSVNELLNPFPELYCVQERSTAVVHHWSNKKNDPKKTINQLVYMAEILGLKDLGMGLMIHPRVGIPNGYYDVSENAQIRSRTTACA